MEGDRYYRVQPKGLDIAWHRSELSNTWETGEYSQGLHVFLTPCELWAEGTVNCVDDPEVIIIEGGESWDDGDVEGVAINPDNAKIVARYTVAEFIRECSENPENHDLDDDEVEYLKEKLEDWE